MDDNVSLLCLLRLYGGAADVIKTATTALQSKLPEDTGMVSTVHGELIVEAPLKDAETVKNWCGCDA